MRSPKTYLALALALAASALAPAAAAASGGTPKVTCERGERAEFPRGQIGYGRLLVLGCIRLPGGARLQVEGRPERSGDGETTCISLTFEPRPTGSFACPRRPPRGPRSSLYLFLHPRTGEPVLAIGTVPSPTRDVTATATTRRGAPQQVEALLLPVSRRLAGRIAAPRGFDLYVAPFRAPIDPCDGITLQPTGGRGNTTTVDLPGPLRRSFMGLPDGGWIAGMTHSWGIGTGATPRKCGPPSPAGSALSVGVAAVDVARA